MSLQAIEFEISRQTSAQPAQAREQLADIRRLLHTQGTRAFDMNVDGIAVL
jgi:hypothetical protein